MRTNKIKRFDEIVNGSLNESFEIKNPIKNAKKYVEFFNKIKYLFVDVDFHFGFDDIVNLIKNNDENALGEDLYQEVSIIYDENKLVIDNAYNQVFGIKEGCGGILFSILFALAFYYAFSRGYFNKLFSSFDKMIGKKGGCNSGGCGDGYDYDSARPGYGKKTKQPTKPTERIAPKPLTKNRVDELLDKINRRGVNSLTPEEKEYLRKNN